MTNYTTTRAVQNKNYITSQGWATIERNWYSAAGELDIGYYTSLWIESIIVLQASAPSSPQTKGVSPVQQSTPKAMNGTKNGAAVAEARPGQVEVQRSLPQEPQQVEHVTLKKKPKCKCCVVQ